MLRSASGVTGKVDESKNTATEKADAVKGIASGVHAPDAGAVNEKLGTVKNTATEKADAVKSIASGVHAPDTGAAKDAVSNKVAGGKEAVNAANSSLADHAPSLPSQDDVSPTGAGSALEGHVPHEG